MADRTRARLRNDRDADQGLAHAPDAARLAPKYVTAVLDPDEGGWIVEAEVVEDPRIPSTADILALYEIELNAEGELLAYRRTRRCMRGQRWSPEQGAVQTTNEDTNGDS
jgi:gas vesicle protein GvpO